MPLLARKDEAFRWLEDIAYEQRAPWMVLLSSGILAG